MIHTLKYEIGKRFAKNSLFIFRLNFRCNYQAIIEHLSRLSLFISFYWAVCNVRAQKFNRSVFDF